MHPSCLCTYDRVAQAPVSRIPLTDVEFSQVMCAMELPGPFQGMKLETFIAQAVREKLESGSGAQLPFSDGDIATMARCVSELENLHWKVRFLLESIINSHHTWMHAGYPNEEKIDEITAGWNLFQLEFVEELGENGTALFKTWAKCSPALTRLLALQTVNTNAA